MEVTRLFAGGFAGSPNNQHGGKRADWRNKYQHEPKSKRVAEEQLC